MEIAGNFASMRHGGSKSKRLGFSNGLVLLLGLLSVPFTAQSQSVPDLFQKARPDVLIVVREHAGGAEAVEVKAVNPEITPDELQKSITTLGERLGVRVTALRTYANRAGDSPNARFIEASFGIDKLSEPDAIRLNEIAQAFVSEHVSGIGVIFENRGVDRNTIESYRSKDIEVAGQYLPGAIGLEYRILANTKEVERFSIPSSKAASQQSQTKKSERNAGPDPSFYALIGVAAIALGALVYSLLLRSNAVSRK